MNLNSLGGFTVGGRLCNGFRLEGRKLMRKAMGPWGQVFCRVRKTTVNFSMCLPFDRRMKSLSGMQVVISWSEPGT